MKYIELSFEEIQEKIDFNSVQIGNLCTEKNQLNSSKIQCEIEKLQYDQFELSRASLTKFANG